MEWTTFFNDEQHTQERSMTRDLEGNANFTRRTMTINLGATSLAPAGVPSKDDAIAIDRA